MFNLNISCATCKAVFKSSDAIYSTSCGHIFHFSCLNKWRSISTSCPQCRSYNPTTHSIYLNFDDSAEYEKIVNDLNSKVGSSKEELKKNQEEIKKKEKKIDDIKRLYNISEQWRAELEDKIHKLSSEIEALKTHTESLEKDKGVENLFDKINEFSTENSKLKKSLSDSETTNMVLNQKTEVLEQRLKHVNSELQAQIAQSLKESSEKIKTEQQPKNSDRRQKTKSDQSRGIVPSSLNNTLRTRNVSKEFKPFRLAQPNDRKVIICSFPRDNLVYPLEDTVIFLASKMSISLATEDILNVSTIDRSMISEKIVLLVEFTTIDGKIKFLTHRNRLKFDALTKSIQLKEYIDEFVYQVFMYANRNLRGNGYEYIGCKDNKVYAKKKLSDTEEILIKCRDDVDKLLGKNPQLRRYSRLGTGTSEETGRNLCGNGYEYIGSKANKVYAMTKLSDTEEILIKCWDDIDKLLGKNPYLRSYSRLGTGTSEETYEYIGSKDNKVYAKTKLSDEEQLYRMIVDKYDKFVAAERGSNCLIM